MHGEIRSSPASGDDAREGLPSAYIPRRRGDVLELDLGDGLIIYDRDANLVHHLNSSAALVWRMCKGESPVSELVQVLVDVLGLSIDKANAQVAELLRELDELSLTEDASIDGPVTNPLEGVVSW